MSKDISKAPHPLVASHYTLGTQPRRQRFHRLHSDSDWRYIL